MNIRVLIADFLYCKGDLQEYINRRFRSKTQIVVDREEYDYIARKDGIKFRITDDFFTIRDISTDYNISDLDENTIAVDLGANVGGFSVRAAKVCKRVLAVEPLRHKELQDNLDLNNIKNVDVWPCGFGDGSVGETGWEGYLRYFETKTFEDVWAWVSKYKGRRWLKCDIEGCERFFPPHSINNFDRVEMELHHWQRESAERLTRELKETHNVVIDHVGSYGSIGVLHATRK